MMASSSAESWVVRRVEMLVEKMDYSLVDRSAYLSVDRKELMKMAVKWAQH